MKGLYIVYQHPQRRTGLFYATHHRIKHSIPYLSEVKIINLSYYDNWFVSILKSSFGLKPTKKGDDRYIYNGLEYENFWIKRSLFHSITPWGKFDKIRNNKLFCNESFIAKNKLQALFKEAKNFDFIMAHWAIPNGRLAMKLATYSNKPFFVTYHGSDLNTAPYINRPSLSATLELLKEATLNITVSKALMDKASQMCPRAKLIMSPNGIASDVIQTEKTDKIKSNEVINIIFIGNLIDDKRADKLPEIISSIVSKSTRKLHFNIVGEGKYKENIQNELNKQDVSFTLYGQVSPKEVYTLLKHSYLLILPSRTEGMPLVILEAIGTRTVPVASNVGGISEILESDFIVDESDTFINDFASKVVSLIDNPKFPQLDIKSYSWDVIMKNEIEKIKELI